MSESERLKFWLHLLEMEVESLRSVISELDVDCSQYLQWNKAEAIDNLKNSLRRPDSEIESLPKKYRETGI